MQIIETQQKQAEQKMSELIQVLKAEQHGELWRQIDERRLQELLESLIKIYACKLQSLDPVSDNIKSIVAPLPEGTDISHTDAVIFVDRLLEMMGIDLFEVQMFRSLCFRS